MKTQTAYTFLKVRKVPKESCAQLRLASEKELLSRFNRDHSVLIRKNN